jgi:hypothetical protein
LCCIGVQSTGNKWAFTILVGGIDSYQCGVFHHIVDIWYIVLVLLWVSIYLHGLHNPLKKRGHTLNSVEQSTRGILTAIGLSPAKQNIG